MTIKCCQTKLCHYFVFYRTAILFLEIIYSLVTSAKQKAILFLFGCSEVNSTWLITSELANQRARKALFTCVVYTNNLLYRGLCLYVEVCYIEVPLYYDCSPPSRTDTSRPGASSPVFVVLDRDSCTGVM